MRRTGQAVVAALAVALGVAAAGGPALTGSAEAAAPSWFSDTVAFSGLTMPTSVRFAPDGQVFVAQKGGQIIGFDGIDDATPSVVADLSGEVHDFWDRGLLGFAVDPGFPASPYLYALYTVDARVGVTSGTTWGDGCPTPPGPTSDGCPVGSRLVRLTVGGLPLAVTATKTLIEGEWCAQSPSHSIGDLRFGPDGALYASAGEGADVGRVDYGQWGGSPGSPTRRNPCGDPPGGIDGDMSPPTAEGGALRSQSLRRPDGEPRLLNGTIIRVDPATGDALADNPRGSSTDANERRVVGFGLRNPFRFAFRPDLAAPGDFLSDLWIGDVGWGDWEEINRIQDPLASPPNFGWPCYEGTEPKSSYIDLGLSLCAGLVSDGTAVPPIFAYRHGQPVSAGDTCLSPPGGSNEPFGNSRGAIAGIAFYPGGSYPERYDGALFFADYSRNCIWAMLAGTDGAPDPTTIETFVAGATSPVALEPGPDGDLFYVSLDTGSVHRLSAVAPSAVATAAGPAAGALPLTVDFDGTASSAPAGHQLFYAWDLDGDGTFGDSTVAQPSRTYHQGGAFDVRLEVTDTTSGLTNVSAPIRIVPGGSAPELTVATPTSAVTWGVGDSIGFAGSATDAQDGDLPASALRWDLVMRHCDSDSAACHSHVIETFAGVSEGTFAAPDHEYPSHLELTLRATDSSGLEASETVSLEPRTVLLQLESTVVGAQLTAGALTRPAPFTATVIEGSSASLSAPSLQTIGGTSFAFVSWSDGGARSHAVTASAPATYLATYAAVPGGGSGGGGGGGGSGSADLRLTGVAEPASAPVGGTITWRLRVSDDTNYGPATGVFVDVELPAGVVLAAAQTDRGPGCVSTGAQRLRCGLDWLSSGAPYGNVTLVTSVTVAGELVLAASVGASSADPRPADNTLVLTANTPAAVREPPTATKRQIVKAVLAGGKALPRAPVAGRRFTLTVPVRRSDTGAPLRTGEMSSRSTVAGKVVAHRRSFRAGKARVSLLVPRKARARLLGIRVGVTTSGQTTRRSFTYRVR